MSSVQYIVFIWRDTDGVGSSTFYEDWQDAYDHHGNDLDPDIQGAWEIGVDGSPEWFTPSQLQDVLDEEDRDARISAQYGHPLSPNRMF